MSIRGANHKSGASIQVELKRKEREKREWKGLTMRVVEQQLYILMDWVRIPGWLSAFWLSLAGPMFVVIVSLNNSILSKLFFTVVFFRTYFHVFTFF